MAKNAYTIYLKSYSGTKVKLPILPAELPEISQAADIEDFVTVKGGHYTIIGQKQQPTISVEHMVPKKGKRLDFAVSKTTGSQVLKILKESHNRQTPLKYVIAKQEGGYYINDQFAVGPFSYKIDKKGDYIISFELTGWKKYSGWKKGANIK